MSAILFAVITISIATSCSLGQRTLPAVLPHTTIEETNSGTCPVANVVNEVRNDTVAEIQSILHASVVPELNRRFSGLPQCHCSGAGRWTRIAYLNMTDPSQQCPPQWRLYTTPVRGCGRTSNIRPSCDSAIFPSYSQSYSRVCGRINAFQRGTHDALHAAVVQMRGIDAAYVDGVSVTHGAAGSRQHIWTFTGALYENDPSYSASANCACTNINQPWPFQLPSYIGNNYFCDTANVGPSWSRARFYVDDPLWDGDGCGPTNACCEFNNPPWFCTTLPQPTSDDIELRICGDEEPSSEDSIVYLVDIYVM